jgi:hypothetical protein
MSQNDFNLANQGFPSMRADINSALQALASNSSGDTAPATPYANQFWYETDTNTLYIRDEANTAWLALMVIDGATGSPSFNSGNVGISSGNLSVGSIVGLARVNTSANGASQAGLNIYDTAGGSTAYVCVNFIRNGAGVGFISTTNTNTAYVTSSDYRLKENVQPMQDALGKIAQLNPVTYTWKVDGSDGQGFIAHELQAVIPDCVTGEKDAVGADGKPQYQGVDSSFLVATLVAAMKEQQATIMALEARLSALEN